MCLIYQKNIEGNFLSVCLNHSHWKQVENWKEEKLTLKSDSYSICVQNQVLRTLIKQDDMSLIQYCFYLGPELSKTTKMC